MLITLSLFSDCIASFTILLQENRSGLSKTKIRVELTDGSCIFLREIIIKNILIDYAYHWQNAGGSLITRWDNAAHYPEISTFPHHKHVLQENNIQPSNEQDLFHVMSFIKRELMNII